MGHRRRGGKKGGLTPTVRTAAQPGQTLNVDLCLVPATHPLAQKLPAVSCSSGRLVAERPRAPHAAPTYPGQVFAEPERAYADAMQAFVAASAASSAANQAAYRRSVDTDDPTRARAAAAGAGAARTAPHRA